MLFLKQNIRLSCNFTAHAASTRQKKRLSAIAFKDTKWRKNFVNFQIDRVKVKRCLGGQSREKTLKCRLK